MCVVIIDITIFFQVHKRSNIRDWNEIKLTKSIPVGSVVQGEGNTGGDYWAWIMVVLQREHNNCVVNLICRGNLGSKHDRSQPENIHTSGRRPGHEVQFWTL